ncbi:GTPase IMAP family member 4-like, partial [Sinocyclocheilus rhinocerous]|uniref:GTPase IMAP family member 4-like n=1 Tax=Sinocyclocheilus rhinocerous TaxID=307959 RepID=UPI0007B93D08
MFRQIPVSACAEPDTHVSSLSSRRIVLLGKTGVGKSAAGNTILGQKEFISQRCTNTVTSECLEKKNTVSGRYVSVVDTPGFINSKMKHEELMTEIARSFYLSSPGPHGFLIVFKADDRFTEDELQIPQKIEMIFGQKVLKYSIILFTRGDQLDGEPIENDIEKNSRLRHLIQQCGGRYHVLNNKDENNREQVNDLLKKIDTMIEQNGGGHYSNQLFQEAERFRREEDERRQQEEKQRQEIERVRKEAEKIKAEFEAKKSELERLEAERKREEEKRKQEEKQRQEEHTRKQQEDKRKQEEKERKQEKLKQEEIERVRKETEKIKA